jgi:hypothetical protein
MMPQAQSAQRKCEVLLFAPEPEECRYISGLFQNPRAQIVSEHEFSRAVSQMQKQVFDIIWVIPGKKGELIGSFISEAHRLQSRAMVIIGPEILMTDCPPPIHSADNLRNLFLDSVALVHGLRSGEGKMPSEAGENLSGIHESELQAGAHVHASILSSLLHDMRTPIVAIGGYARMVLDGRAGVINEKQRHYLSIVAENAGRLTNLAREIDMFRGAPPLRYSPVSLSKTLTDLTEDVRGHFPEIRIELLIPANPVIVAADEPVLRLALRDLLGYAAKHIRGGDGMTAEITTKDGEKAVLRIITPGDVIPGSFPGGVSEVPDSARNGAPVTAELWEARRIFLLHGCRIAISSTDENSVLVEFPLFPFEAPA